MRKKLDSRIRTLVENGVKLRHRSLFVVVGDKGRDQVVNLHYMLSKLTVKARPSVLWCYKKELHLSSHAQKRVRQIKKQARQGLLDADKDDPFALFVSSTNIRYCYYKDTHKILGNTFGMCVLQDFEALTPNLLARTIETVEGGGIIVMLLSTLTSLTQLYTLTMDVHSRLRTESHSQVTGRFNERLVLSLASCKACILMDDELNILPTSTHVREIREVEMGPDGQPLLPSSSVAAAGELRELKETLADSEPAGPLVKNCRTLDQARALITFLDAASEKTLRSTVALTASRGRGKSAALGLAIAGALALGYSNIFVTAPSPENLKTLFEFVCKGFDALEYKEHQDYDIVQSMNPDYKKAVIRINVFRTHRQTVQYIQPQHHDRLGQAELLVIDEAAAIPLPTVRAMLGPYLVFLCSTVNGYEGTGRSLSLKLLQQLRVEGAKSGNVASTDSGAAPLGRTFREVQLQEPIRYAAGDQVEAWLHSLLCLDAAEHVPPPPARLPHPDACDLYLVERDTLFSYHAASEILLQRAVALLAASHYRNTPDDLILLADAPAHRLFVLLGPVDETKNALPDLLCVMQVALEGEISKESAMQSLREGRSPMGDMIPWTVLQQFRDRDFPGLSGARIVRIAVHPDMPRAGYGSRAVQLLRAYYQGEMVNLGESGDDDDDASDDERRPSNGQAGPKTPKNGNGVANGTGGLLTEHLSARSNLPPLLINLADRPPETLHYLGTSYGLTQSLYSFWRKNGFSPVYLRQTKSDVTGEHSIFMLSPLESPEVEGTAWIDPFVADFRQRFRALLPGAFREFAPGLALSILDPRLTWNDEGGARDGNGAMTGDGARVTKADGAPLTAWDLNRLEAYCNTLVDMHLVRDLLPPLANAYFAGHLHVTLSVGQAAILLALGLQQRDVDAVEAGLNLPAPQIMALFNKAVKKMFGVLRAAKVAEIDRSLPKPHRLNLKPHAVGLDEDLEEGAKASREAMQRRINGSGKASGTADEDNADLAEALGGRVAVPGDIVSVPVGDGEGTHGSHGGASLYRRSEKKGKGKRKGGDWGGGSGGKKHRK